jgi:two-component system sensor histidine kinase AgrC
MRDDDNLKLSPGRWTIAIITALVLVFIANYAVLLAYKLPIIILMFYIVCQLMFKYSFIRKIFLSVIAITIIWIIEFAVSILFMLVLKQNTSDIISSPKYYILFSVTNVIFLMLTIIIFKTKRFMSQMDMSNNKRTKTLMLMIIVFQFINVIVQFFTNHSLLHTPKLSLLFIVSYFCSIISIAILLYSAKNVIDKDRIISVSNEYNENLSVYNGVLQSSIESQRKIAHEHGNQLSVLSGYVANGNLEKAKNYIEKIIGSCNCDSELLYNIKESGLKALLVFKTAMIERKNIDFELAVDEDIENTIIPSEDLCQVMGIFLDNAIDAAVQSEDPYITLSFIKKENGLDITIMNSIKDANIDTEKIYQKGYSSKGEGRGFGLHIVDEIIKKYKELNLQTRIEDGLFIQELQIFSKSTSSTMI